MFTGMVEEVGRIITADRKGNSARLKIEAEKVLEDIKIGDSIAVNGICLTVTSFGKNYFTADVMHETLRRSSIGEAASGSPVNLERAMAANGRFGGHIVTGHIDGTGTICEVKSDEIAICYSMKAPEKIMHYIVEKGSIAIDGISLTVARLTDDSFSVSVIPHTGEETTLLTKKPGDIVNLENDIVGKYVERLLNFNTSQKSTTDNKTDRSTNSKITMDFLAENGF